MILLLATSIVGVTFIIERGLALRRRMVVPQELERALARCHGREDLPSLRDACMQQPSSLARIVLAAIEQLPFPRTDNAEAVETRARHEVQLLERGLVVLEIVVGISPLLGLVGTVHGLITLFGDLGAAGMSDNSVLARGISIALNTTLAGLLIAIPSLIAWSYYSRRVETFAVQMETQLDDFLRRQYRRPLAGGSAVPRDAAGVVSEA